MIVLLVLFVIVPVVELAVIIQVGQWIGFWQTLFLLLAVSIAGAWLVKWQGVTVMRRIAYELGARRVPGRSLVDGALILVAGALMLTPGFVTDFVGLLLLVPLTRVRLREFLVRRWSRNLVVRRIA